MLEIVYNKVRPCLQDAEAFLDMLLGDYVNASRSRGGGGGVTVLYGSIEDRDAAAQNVLKHVNELARIGILVTEVNVDLVRSNPEDWRYLPDRVCKSCGIESGGDRPFQMGDMCAACWKRERAYTKGMVCKSCGIASGGGKPFARLDRCGACSSEEQAYAKGLICSSCGIESGGDRPFAKVGMCVSCDNKERAYAKGRICKYCGIESGGDRPFNLTDMCVACQSRERAYAKGRICKYCGIESGGDRPFNLTDMCNACQSRELAYVKGRICKYCGIESGGNRPFARQDKCSICVGNERAYAKDRICKSCGIESGGDRPFRLVDMCVACNARKNRFESIGWPSLCVAGIHTPPPPREIVYAEKISPRQRDFPPCNCHIDETGQVVPDSEIRYIPETDQPDPSRGYSPLKERREAMGLGPKRRTRDFDPTGRKGYSKKSPRRSTRGGSPFDIGPRRP